MLRELLCDSVDFRGHAVRPRTLGDEADFVAHVRRCRLADAHALRDALTAEEFAELVRRASEPLEWQSDAVQHLAASDAGAEWFARRAVGCDPETFDALWRSPSTRAEMLDVVALLNAPTPAETAPVPGGVSISDGEVVILLESRGYRRDEIRRLPRRYARHLLSSDPDEVGRRKTSKTPTVSHEDQMRHVLRLRGLPAWRVEQIVEKERAKRGNRRR